MPVSRMWTTPHGQALEALLRRRNVTAQAAEQQAGMPQARLSRTAQRARLDLRSLIDAVEACGGELCILDRTTGTVYPLRAADYPEAQGRDAEHMARMRSARRK